MDYGETFEACAKREVLEETGIEIEKIRFLTATNDRMLEERKHYVTIFVAASLCDERAQPNVIARLLSVQRLLTPPRSWSQINARNGSGCLGQI